MRYVMYILQAAQPFYFNDSFKQVVNRRWKPLALHVSLKCLHRTGNQSTTVLLKPFCNMFVDNLIISLFRTDGKLKLLQDECAVKKTSACLCVALANKTRYT